MTDLRLADRRASLPFFAVSLLAPLAVSACAKKQERAPRPPATVAVAQARRATVPYVIEANGIVTPLQTVAVTSQDDGLILTVDFAEGQEVRQGQSLFHLDPRPYQNAYDQAVAVFGRDSATWAYAREEADRYKKMLDAKVITPEEGGTQMTAAATAEATLKADRANIAQAKFNLENTVIRAPIGGKTGSLLVKQGNLVHAGAATPLVVINQVRPILVRFAIPSAQLGLLLQYGAKGGLPVAAVPGGIAPASPSIDSLAASVMNPINDAQGESGAPMNSGGGHGHRGAGGGNGSAATDGAGGPPGAAAAGPNVANGTVAGSASGGNAANMDGGPVASNGSPAGRGMRGRGARGTQSSGQPSDPVQQGDSGDRMMGKLTFIDNAVDTTTATVQLKAVFDNTSGRLWAGQFATTSLHLFDEDSALVVPQQAVQTGQQGSYVYIVDQTDTARQRAVTVERNAGGLAIISAGLRPGDNVVTDGQSRLTPDSPVRIRGANDAEGASAGGRRGRGGRGKKGGGGGNGGGNGSGGGAG